MGKNPRSLPQMELDGQLLHYNQNTKFWSVYLTIKLNWRLQTENVISKTRKRLKIVSFSFLVRRSTPNAGFIEEIL